MYPRRINTDFKSLDLTVSKEKFTAPVTKLAIKKYGKAL